MKRFLILLGFAVLSTSTLAATGPASLTWTRATTYTDGSALAAADITGHGILCTFTPTGGVAVPCVFTPTSVSGNGTTGNVTVTYPPQGGRACFQVTTRVQGAESAPSTARPEACKDFAPLTPSAPTNVTITIQVTVNINGVPASALTVEKRP